MQEVFTNPAFQAGVAPFFAALVVAAPLRRTRVLGLALVVALAVVVAMTMGLSFEVLTAVRKLALVGLVAALPILAFELTQAPMRRRWRAALAGAAALAAAWVLLRILSQQEDTGRAVATGLACAAFMALIVDGSVRGGDRPLAAASASLMLGLGAGALALLGASAQLAQIGIAIGAGSGAVLLLQMISGRAAPSGWTLGLVGGLVSGLVCLLAVFTGSLPWYSLLPMLLVPWAPRLLPDKPRPAWLGAILASALALLPALAAIGLAWHAAKSGT